MMSVVSRNLGITDAPTAARAGRPGWRDPRLWIGVALVAASVLVGARLLGGADNTIEVWAASADLSVGQEVTEQDLTARRVRFDEDADADHYLLVGDALPDEATLARAVGSGELLPAAALGRADEGLLEVPIWAPYDAVPGNLTAGSTVDIYVTPTADDKEAGARLVLDDVVVIAAPRSSESFGPSGNRQVLIGVSDDDQSGVGLALAAAKDDRVAIAREG
jgi:hypothetical protein